MESLINRWKSAIQLSDSKISRSDQNRKAAQQSREQSAAKSKKKFSNKDSRTEIKKSETPNKKVFKKLDKIDICLNSILEIVECTNPDKVRPKIKALLQDLLLSVSVDRQGGSQSKMTQRAYSDIQNRFLQSQRQRQYLRGKDQLNTKRIEGLEREISHYSKMQKLLDGAVSRQAQLRAQIEAVRAQRERLKIQIREQQFIFSEQVASIRQLIHSLQGLLPTN